MSGAYILDKLLKYSKLNGKTFSEKVGLARPQAIYDIQNGKTKNISANMANKIISVFPEINKSWLLTGDGEMLNDNELALTTTDNNMPSTNNQAMASSLALDYIATLKEQLAMMKEQLREKDALIRRLSANDLQCEQNVKEPRE